MGGAHQDHAAALDSVREAIARNLAEIAKIPLNRLLKERYEKSRDQIAGMCRELFDDYGVEATGLDAGELEEPSAITIAELRRVDLLVTTPGYETVVRRVGARVGVPVVIADVRPDLLGGEWRMLLRHPVYVVLSDERFGGVLTQFFAEIPGAEENLRMLVVGRDDLRLLPADAPVYLTRAASDALAGAPIGGRIVPSARVFSVDAARDLVSFIVRANIDALSTRIRAGQPARERI